jgi:hypothetical protein
LLLSFGWIDSDLPLFYEYKYSADKVSFATIQSRSELSYGPQMLPSGNSRYNYSIYVSSVIYDSLSAGTTVVRETVVRPPQSVVNVQSVLSELVGDSNDLDSLKLAILASASIVNSVDCSAAPDCDALNRDPCTTVPNTCGNCKSPSYIGDTSFANSMCVVPKWNRLLRGEHMESLSECSSDLECGLLRMCDKNTSRCLPMMKTCPNLCSGHGRCIFVSKLWFQDSYNELKECPIDDVDCTAICKCEFGYGGRSCFKSEEALEQSSLFRTDVISKLTSLLYLEDADVSSVLNWKELVNLLTAQHEELTVESRALVKTIVSKILDDSMQRNIPATLISDVIQSVQKLFWYSSDLFTMNSSSILAQSEMIERSLLDVSHLIKSYSLLQSNNLVLGEQSLEKVAEGFRTLSSRVDLQQNASLIAPLLEIEKWVGVEPHQVHIYGQSTSGASDIGVSLISTDQSLFYNSSFLSDSLQLHFSSPPCSFGDPNEQCVAEFVFQLRGETEWRTQQERNNVTLSKYTCQKDVMQTHYHACSNDDIEVTYFIPCNGSWTGVVSVQCPLFERRPHCAMIQGRSAVEGMCDLLLWSDSNVTCRCPMVHSFTLLDNTINQQSSPQIVPIMTQTAVEFALTWSTADDLSLDDVRNSWIVLSVLATVSVIGMLGAFGAIALDKRHKKVKNSSAGAAAFPNKLDESAVRHASEESLPHVLRESPLVHIVVNELKLHHKYLSVFFNYSQIYPRAMRVLMLAGSVLFVMFGNAMTYNVAYPDDSSCSGFDTEIACEKEMSSLLNDSKCYWSESERMCFFRDVNDNVLAAIYISIISCLYTTPLIVLQDYLITKKIFARQPEESSVIHPAGKDQLKSGRLLDVPLQDELAQLVTALLKFRSHLDPIQKLSFDEMWGTSDDSVVSENLRKLYIVDLEKTRKLFSVEYSGLNFCDNKSSYIINSFQRDLLPEMSNLVLKSKGIRDMDVRPPTAPAWQRHVACAYVLSSQLAIMFYLFLFATQQSEERQKTWFRIFLVWVVVEVFILATVVVLISDVFVPSLIRGDIRRVNEKMLRYVKSYAGKMVTHKENRGSSMNFNAALYFYCSYRLALKCPGLPVSAFVLQYSTPWPKQSYRNSSSLINVYGIYFGSVVKCMLQLDASIQDAAIKIVTTVFFGNAAVNVVGTFRIAALLVPIVLLCSFLFGVKLIVDYLYANDSELDESFGMNNQVEGSAKLTSRRNSIRQGVMIVRNMEKSLAIPSQEVSQSEEEDNYSATSDVSSDSGSQTSSDSYDDSDISFHERGAACLRQVTAARDEKSNSEGDSIASVSSVDSSCSSIDRCSVDQTHDVGQSNESTAIEDLPLLDDHCFSLFDFNTPSNSDDESVGTVSVDDLSNFEDETRSISASSTDDDRGKGDALRNPICSVRLNDRGVAFLSQFTAARDEKSNSEGDSIASVSSDYTSNDIEV